MLKLPTGLQQGAPSDPWCSGDEKARLSGREAEGELVDRGQLQEDVNHVRIELCARVAGDLVDRAVDE